MYGRICVLLALGLSACGGGGDGGGADAPVRPAAGTAGPLPGGLVGAYVVHGTVEDGFEIDGRWRLVLSENGYEIADPEGNLHVGEAEATEDTLVLRALGGCKPEPVEYGYELSGTRLRLTLQGTDDCGARQVALTFAGDPWRRRGGQAPVFPDDFDARLDTGERYAAPADFSAGFSVRLPDPAGERSNLAWFGGSAEPGVVGLRPATGPAEQEAEPVGVGFSQDSGSIEDLAAIARQTRGIAWSPVRRLEVDGRPALRFTGRAKRDDVVLEEPPSLAGANPLPKDVDTVYFIQAARDEVVVVRSYAQRDRAEAFGRAVASIVRSMRF